MLCLYTSYVPEHHFSKQSRLAGIILKAVAAYARHLQNTM